MISGLEIDRDGVNYTLELTATYMPIRWKFEDKVRTFFLVPCANL